MTANADIAKDSAAILQSSSSVVETILERRAELDRAGKHDQPLVVVLGECFLIPAHAVHLMTVLDSLAKDKEQIAVCYEHSHDIVQKAFTRTSGSAPGEKQTAVLRDQDKTGALTLKCASGLINEYTHKSLLSFLVEQNIPARFTDASSKGSFYLRTLNECDPSTAASMHARFDGKTRSDIDPETPEGFRVRNHHMAVQALDFAKNTHARIVIQNCGNFHVMGREPHFPACDGLAANLKTLGAAVLAMPRLMKDIREQDISKDHGLSEKEFRPVRGLPETAIDMNAPETAYASALMERCGLGAARLTADSGKDYAKDVAQIFAACQKFAPGASPPLKKPELAR